MNDGDRSVTEALGQEIARHSALDVVAAADTEHGREALFGELRVGGERRDHQDASFGIDPRGRNRRDRAVMPDHQGDACFDQPCRGRDRLIGIARVVDHDHLDPLAEHPALGVEVRNRGLGADLVACPSPRHVAGQRRRQTDQNLGVGARSAKCRNGNHTGHKQPAADHGDPPCKWEYSGSRSTAGNANDLRLSIG
jgi:hypothetical protein